MTILAILLIIVVVTELRYKPRFRWTTGGDLLVHYNKHRYTNERDDINITQLFNDSDFNKY